MIDQTSGEVKSGVASEEATPAWLRPAEQGELELETAHELNDARVREGERRSSEGAAVDVVELRRKPEASLVQQIERFGPYLELRLLGDANILNN